MLRKTTHKATIKSLKIIRNSDSINILPVEKEIFDKVFDQFSNCNNQQISFVDHSSSILAKEYDINHIFTFDTKDFHILDLTVIPNDSQYFKRNLTPNNFLFDYPLQI